MRPRFEKEEQDNSEMAYQKSENEEIHYTRTCILC